MKVILLFALLALSFHQGTSNGGGKDYGGHSSGGGNDGGNGGNGNCTCGGTGGSSGHGSGHTDHGTGSGDTKNKEQQLLDCLKDAVKKVPELTEDLKEFFCLDKKNPKAVTAKIQEIAEKASCAVDEALGLGDTLEDTVAELSEPVKSLVASVLDLAKNILGDLLCAVTGLVNDITGSVLDGGNSGGGGGGGLLGGRGLLG